MASFTREFSSSSLIAAAAALALAALPAFGQERPSPQGHGSGEHAVSRPSGGGSAPAPSGGGTSTSSSSGGSSTGSGAGGGDHAISRGANREGRRGGASGGSAARGGGAPKSVVLPSGPTSAYDPGDRNAPNPRAGGNYARPRGNRPPTDRAVPRTGDISNVPDLAWRRDPYWGYGYWQYDRWMPFYYGPWGGYFYYDPFWWDYYYGYAPSYYGYGGGGYVSSGQSDYETGGLKLKVKPRHAQVYVDGYFSGVVDDFDGVFQKLKLRAGAHRIELRADGYQPSLFDVLVVAGETVTYRADLQQK
jgi:hypothetical protein